MAFVRVKNIKGKDYAYLVECKYRKKGPKQKVRCYLGRLTSPDLKVSIAFTDLFEISDVRKYVKKRNKNRIVDDLIKWEMFKHGIDAREKGMVFKLNEGFLCKYNIIRLKRFNYGGDEREVGIRLAKQFIDTGINVPEEVFVEYFKKITR